MRMMRRMVAAAAVVQLLLHWSLLLLSLSTTTTTVSGFVVGFVVQPQQPQRQQRHRPHPHGGARRTTADGLSSSSFLSPRRRSSPSLLLLYSSKTRSDDDDDGTMTSAGSSSASSSSSATSGGTTSSSSSGPVSTSSSSSSSSLAFLDDADDGTTALQREFAEYLQRKRLRAAIANCPLFFAPQDDDAATNLNNDSSVLLAVERIVQACTTVRLDPGTVLFRKGDEIVDEENDGLYIVQSGMVQAVVLPEDDDENEDDEEEDGQQGDGTSDEQQSSAPATTTATTGYRVLRTYEAGGVFGELSLLYDGQPRAATVRVPDDGGGPAALWRLSKSDFRAIFGSTGGTGGGGGSSTAPAAAADRMKRAVERDAGYASYVERRDLEAALRRCKIFKGIQPSDLERTIQCMEEVRVPVPNEESGDDDDDAVIIREGDVGDSMYFIKKGTVVVSRKDRMMGGSREKDVVLAELGPGDHFGELALLFRQKRAATVRARRSDEDDNDEQEVTLWKIDREGVYKALEDYPLGERSLELLKEKYKDKDLWSTLRRASLSEIVDLIRSYSRPRKKNVTLHSIVGTLYAGMFFVTIIPMFAPKLRNELGFPQIFDMLGLARSPMAITQCRITQFLAAVLSVLGTFRIPKNAPYCRKIFFNCTTWTMVMTWVFGDSNVLGGITTGFTFDAFSRLGGLFLVATQVFGAIFTLKLIDDSIAGPNIGRETVPLFTNRVSGTIIGTLYYLGVCLQFLMVIPQMLDPAGYAKHALPFWQSSGFSRLPLYIGFSTNAYLAFGSLWGTLVLEKRMSKRTGTILTAIFILMLSFDQGSLFLMDRKSQVGLLLQESLKWMASVRRKYCLDEISIGFYLIMLANAIRKRVQKARTKTG